MTNSADLAKDFMNEAGMAKGVAYDAATGQLCMVGALNRVRVYYPEATIGSTMVTATQVIKEQYPDRLYGLNKNTIATFNDHPDTTLDDVNVVWEKTSILLDEMV